MGSLRLTFPLLVTTVAALGFVIAMTLFGWFATAGFDARASGHGGAAVLSSAFGVARHASLFESQASVATRSLVSPEQAEARAVAMEADRAELYRYLAFLEGQGYDDHVAGIRQHTDALVASVEEVERRRPELRQRLSENRSNYRSLRYGIGKEIDIALVTSLDDQFDHMMSAYGRSGTTGPASAGTLSREDVLSYHHIFNLMGSAGHGVGKLLGGSLTSFPESVQLIREDYDAMAQRMEHSVAFLSEHGASSLQPDAIPLVEELLAYGVEDGVFWRDLDVRLTLVEAEQRQLADNGRILKDLLHGVDLLVDEVGLRSAVVADSAAQTVNTWRVVILVVGALAVLATLVSAGYFGTRGHRE
jgi:hypothetical protein